MKHSIIELIGSIDDFELGVIVVLVFFVVSFTAGYVSMGLFSD